MTSVFTLVPTSAAQGLVIADVAINEIRIDQSGTDNDEYFELKGTPDGDLTGYTYVVIGDGTAGSGVIEEAVDLTGQSIEADGLFLAAESTFGDGDPFTADSEDFTTSLNFENSDNVTHLLVSGFTGSDGDDLDTDDDGTLDVEPWTMVVDSVALIETPGSGDQVYSANQVGPDGSFVPGHVYFCTEGPTGWNIGGFSLGANDTPGDENVCDFPESLTPIYDIQGDGDSSPVAGTWVRTSGIVTGDFQHTGGLGGFFLQDPDGDANTDTSDGIFVAATDPFPVVEGAHVEVLGFVSENFGQTEIGNVQEVLNSGTNGGITPTVISPPFMEEMEKYEGMLVEFDPTLYATDTFNLHRFGEVWLTAGGVSVQPTDAFPAGTDADDLAAANMANSVLLDDGSTWSNPDPIPYIHGPAPGTLRLGDYVDGLTGNIGFAFSQYRVHPTETVSFSVGNPRPAVPSVGGDVKVAGFNVLNYWTTLGGRGAGDAGQLAVQTDKLVDAIRDLGADIVALQEIENDPAHTPIETLVAALNTAEGSDVWSWIGELDYYNLYPIRNEIIYRNDRVVASGDPMTIADEVFDDIPPGRTDPLGRPPVAQTFMYGLEKFTVMSNHFKSKGCTGSSGGDLDQGDGQSCFNATRVAQAERVLEFVDYIVSETGDQDVLLLGDLNSYMEEDPIHTLEGELENVLEAFQPDGWGYNFFATFAFPYVGRGNLDHAFATLSMGLKVTGAATWNINADEPRYLDWFDTSKVAPDGIRSSDHDPVIVGLSMAGADFGDIGDSVFKDDILLIAALGLTFGCNPPTNDLYCAERELTVGELIAFLRRALELPAVGTDYYTDDNGHVFEEDLNAAADVGIGVECGTDMICPDDPVSRALTAALLKQAFGLADTGADYFTDDDGNTHEGALNSAREAGLIFGCNPPTNDLVCPADILNRGMVAAVLARAALLGLF